MNKQDKLKRIIFLLSAVIALESALLVFLWIRWPKGALPIAKKPPVAIKGKIAIVLDDWGYSLNDLAIAEKIKYPLTMAILPNLNYSRKVAQVLRRRGFEIILHLPLEPKENMALEKDTITTAMDGSTINGIIIRDLIGVPYIRGVSNHMGSKVTEDPRTMEFVLKALKKKRLYFLDSYVTADSVCSQVAKKMHVGFVKRDVFLDNEKDAEYIKRQIYKLKTVAGINGQAIGIGHDREVTLSVLKEVMPELEKEGYKFVFVSELVR